jgi:hypothetical protein
MDSAMHVYARPDDRERWTAMYGMTGIVGEAGVFATLLLLQRGHGPRDELWEPEVLLLILFLGGLVAVVTWLVVRVFPKVRGDERPEAPRDSAEEILRERFARGEISSEEYVKSYQVLHETPPQRSDADREDG